MITPKSSGPNCPLKACVVKAWLTRVVLLGLSGAFKIWGDMKTEERTIWGGKREQQEEVSNQEGSGRCGQIRMKYDDVCVKIQSKPIALYTTLK